MSTSPLLNFDGEFYSGRFLVAATACFLVLQLVAERLSWRWQFARRCAPIDASCYGVASGIAAVLAVYALYQSGYASSDADLRSLVCGQLPRASGVDTVLALYYLSKFAEFRDIMLCILNGFPINPHFRWHHLTTPSLAWVMLHGRAAHAAPFIVANLVMHFFLCLYLGGHRTRIFFLATRVIGHVQLLIGIAGTLAALWLPDCARGDGRGELWLLFLYTSYFVLFQLEIRDDAKQAMKLNKADKAIREE